MRRLATVAAVLASLALPATAGAFDGHQGMAPGEFFYSPCFAHSDQITVTTSQADGYLPLHVTFFVAQPEQGTYTAVWERGSAWDAVTDGNHGADHVAVQNTGSKRVVLWWTCAP